MPGVASRAVSAWTAIIDMWCATTSCSSRAMRARSPRAMCSSGCRRRPAGRRCAPAPRCAPAGRSRPGRPPGPDAASSTARTRSSEPACPAPASASTRNGRARAGARNWAASARAHAVPAEPVQDDQLCDQARDRQRPEDREREHAGRADGHGGRGRPEKRQRHRGARGERAHADQAGHAHPGARRLRAIASVMAASASRAPATAGACGASGTAAIRRAHCGPSAAPVTCCAHVAHCRRPAGAWRHPGRGYRRPSCGGSAKTAPRRDDHDRSRMSRERYQAWKQLSKSAACASGSGRCWPWTGCRSRSPRAR